VEAVIAVRVEALDGAGLKVRVTEIGREWPPGFADAVCLLRLDVVRLATDGAEEVEPMMS
jgi:hypothetical protein